MPSAFVPNLLVQSHDSRSMHVLQGGLHTLLFQLSQLLHEEGWIVSCCNYSPSEPNFSKFICCQNMVEIHGYNEHVNVTGEDDNLCHATLSDNINSVRNYLVNVLSPTIQLRTMRRSLGCAVKWFIAYRFMSCSSMSLFAADGQKVAWYGLSSFPVTLMCSL